MPDGQDDPIYQKYYNALEQAYGPNGTVEKGAFTVGYDDFKTKIADQGYAQKIYGALQTAYGPSGTIEKGAFTAPFQDFYSKVGNPDVVDAQNFISGYLNSPKATKAVDQITYGNYINQASQSVPRGTMAQDASQVSRPAIVRLPQQTVQDRTDYTQAASQNPDLARNVLTQAKHSNPADAKTIDKSMYLLDANQRPHSKAVVSYNAGQIDAGNYSYDLKNKQLIANENPVDAIFRGMQSHSQALDDYHFFTSASDPEAIAKLEGERQDYDPDKAVPKASGTAAQMGEMLGGSLTAMGKFAGPAAVLGPFGETAATLGSAVGAVLGGQDFHNAAYTNTLKQSYNDLRTKGFGPMEALHEAKDQADYSSQLAAIQGVIAGNVAMGGKAAEFTPVMYSKGFGKVLGDVAQNSAQFAKYAASLAPDMTTQGAIAAGVKALENAHQGKPLGEGTTEAALGQALFVGTLGAVVGTAKGLYNLSKAARTTLVDNYGKTPEPALDAGLAQAITKGGMPMEDASVIRNEITGNRSDAEIRSSLGSPLTPEADTWIRMDDEGAHVKNMNPMVARIARENGIQTDENTTPDQILSQLRERQASVKMPDTFISSPNTQENGQEAQANAQIGGQVNPAEGAEKNVTGTAPSIPIVNDPNLRTLDYGDFKGQKESPESKAQIDKDILNDDPVGKSGEKLSDFVKRAIPAIDKVIEDPDDNTVIVSHSSVIKAYRVWEQMGKPDISKIEESAPETGRIRNYDNIGDLKGVPPESIMHFGQGINNNKITLVVDPEVKSEYSQKLANAKKLSGGTSTSFFKHPLKNIAKEFRDAEGNDKIVDLRGIDVKQPLAKIKEQLNESSESKPSLLKEFAQRYVDQKPEKEGEVVVIKGQNGTRNEITRHGETEDNKTSEYRQDDSELTDKGIAQANKSAQKINDITGGKVTKIVASDLPRTVQTANIIHDIVNPKTSIDAIREPSPSSIFQHPQGATGETGSERPGVEQSQQGIETAGTRQAGQENQSGQQEGGGEGIGIRHASRETRAAATGQLAPVHGESRTPEEQTEYGRQLLAHGADPEKVATDFAKTGAISEENMSIAKAQNEKLAQETNEATEKFGEDSEQANAAKQAEQSWYDNTVKPMQNVWHRTGNIQKGETDLKTGSFTEMKRSFSTYNEADPTQEQSVKLKELSGKVKELTDNNAELVKQLNEKHTGKTGETKTTYKERAQAVADAFRKLKVKPMTFKDENGNDIDVQKMGIGWNELVELGAKAIEKTGEIADGIAAVIDKLKDTGFYKELSDNDKKRFASELESEYQKNAPKIVLTPEEKNITRLEKQLDDLQQGKAKQTGPKRELSAKEKGLQDQIFEAKKNLGLVKSKQLAEKTPEETRDALANEIGVKKGNDFTTQEARKIWTYTQEQYIDKGADQMGDVMSHVGEDLGLTTKQIYAAITAPKGAKEITDNLFGSMRSKRLLMQRAQFYIKTANNNLAAKYFKVIKDGLFAGKTFGHGTVGGMTHAGMDIYDPLAWKRYFPFLAKQFKYSFGGLTKSGLAKYEMEMADFVRHPRFNFWVRNGAQIDPRKSSTDDYQQAASMFRRVTEMGVRGFNALKPYRLAKMEDMWARSSPEEKDDPQTAKDIARAGNLSTGTTADVDLGKTGNEIASTVLFAPKLEFSRWQRLFTEPAKAINTLGAAMRGKEITPAQRAQALRVAGHVGRTVATMGAALAANQGLLLASGSKQRINFDDPSQADWLKFKIGDRQIDATGGMLSSLRFISYLAQEAYAANFGDNQRKKPGDVEKDKFTKMLRGKLSPVASDVIDPITGTDYSGNPLPWSNQKPDKYHHTLSWGEYLTSFAPIPVTEAFRTIQEEAENKGMPSTQAKRVIDGIANGAISGLTGARVEPDYRLEKPEPSARGGGAGGRWPIKKY